MNYVNDTNDTNGTNDNNNLNDLIKLTAMDVLEYNTQGISTNQLSHIVNYRINTFSEFITNVQYIKEIIEESRIND